MSNTNSNLVEIEAKKREGRGKGYARKLRQKGMIPAVICNSGESIPIELNPKVLHKAWLSEGRRFTLNLDGSQREAKIHDVQVHPTKRVPLHVDLTFA